MRRNNNKKDFSKVMDEIGADKWVVSFQIPKSPAQNSQRVRLHQLLFGFRMKKYLYDGILEGWSDGGKRRVSLVPFFELDEATYIVSGTVASKLEELGRRLNIPTRAYEFSGKIFGHKDYFRSRRRR